MALTTLGGASRADERLLLLTRLGNVGYRDIGSGRPIVFFAGAGANADLWASVAASLQSRFRCVMVDLPLGAHRVPLDAGADRSARSLARLILDILVELEVEDVVLVANDTAGGLTLLALGEQHEGLSRIGALVLTNCDSFEHFPPKSLRPFAFLCRHAPRFARFALRHSLRSDRGRRRLARSVAATPLDRRLEHSFFDPSANKDISADFVAAFAGFRPSILLAATPALQHFDKPVLLVWGDADEFFPLTHADRLAATFAKATLTTIAGAKTWVPLDKPDELAAAVSNFATRSEQ